MKHLKLNNIKTAFNKSFTLILVKLTRNIRIPKTEQMARDFVKNWNKRII